MPVKVPETLPIDNKMVDSFQLGNNERNSTQQKQESWNTTQQIQKHCLEIYDTDYCQKNLSATAQRVCGMTDLLCQEHTGENEFWDRFCKTFPEELDKIK